MMVRDVEKFCGVVKEKAIAGDVAGALEMIVLFVLEVICRDSSVAEVFGSVPLDRLCIWLGRRSEIRRPRTLDKNTAVFLVTSLSKVGGHSRVLRDLLMADPARNPKVLITNVNGELRSDDLSDLGIDDGSILELAPTTDLESRLKWLQRQLYRLRPTRTYILQHHFDPLCIAAAQPELARNLIYIHNCDHNLALGVHIPNARHVDYTSKAYYHCRECLGLGENVFWPLVAEIKKSRPIDRPFSSRGYLATCTCGGYEKFESPHMLQQFPYLLQYSDIVPIILKATNGIHVHIGSLSDQMLASIARRLDETGTAPERFVYLPYVPDLATALLDQDIDCYIGSFPKGGGRACIEVMGAGIPLIIHSNYRSTFLSDETDVYPGAFIWRTPDELVGHLSSLTEEILRTHSAMARLHYERNHRPELLVEAIASGMGASQLPAPPRPSYHGDSLQFFLDKLAAGSL